MPILEARGLTKTYHLGSEKVVGVTGATLALEAGAFAALAGPSGSGKTTLLNLLGLLDVPDSGTLLFEGRDVSGLPERERARLRREKLGFVFQAQQLVPVLSAEENVALALWIRGLPEDVCASRARAALAAVGLAGLEGRRPDALSGGQRQGVAVARAAAFGSRVVIMDEPTAALGVRESRRVLELILDVRRRGVAIVLISHNMPHVFEIADRIHVHRLGRRLTVIDPKTYSMSDAVSFMTGAKAPIEMAA